MANPKLATGEIEITVDDLEILSKSKPLPFPLDDYKDVGEETRLKYRYLDLRRKRFNRTSFFAQKWLR